MDNQDYEKLIKFLNNNKHKTNKIYEKLKKENEITKKDFYRQIYKQFKEMYEVKD